MRIKINGWLAILLASALTWGVAVAGDEGATAYLSPFEPEKPLSMADTQAVAVASGWIGDERYPVQDGHKTVYQFGGGQASLVCAPLRLCLVELQAGERVSPNGGIQLGDTARWQATPAVGAGNVTSVVLKPAAVGLETNLVVVTDKRIYHVNLVSRERDYMPAIAWTYPDDADQAWKAYFNGSGNTGGAAAVGGGVSLAGLDFGYRISGCDGCGWKPVRVYTDGKQTVVEVPDGIAEMPALMVINGAGDENLVNYRVNGNRFIVDQVFPEAVLVVGVGDKQQRVSIRKGG